MDTFDSRQESHLAFLDLNGTDGLWLKRAGTHVLLVNCWHPQNCGRGTYAKHIPGLPQGWAPKRGFVPLSRTNLSQLIRHFQSARLALEPGATKST